MVDIARLGFSVATGELAKGKTALDALVPAAERVTKASVAMTRADLDRAKASLAAVRATESATAADIQAAAMAVKKAAAVHADTQAELSRSNAVNVAAAGTTRLTNAVSASAAGNANQANSANAAAAGITAQGNAATVAAGKLSRLGAAANDNINRLQSTPANIAAQFQDIGVTAAAGMNPLLIALQQGTQLSAAFAGGIGGIGAALKQIFSPMALLTIAAVALIAYLIQLATSFFTAGSAATSLSESLEKTKFATSAVGDAQSILGNVMDMTTGKINTQIPALLALAKAQILVASLQAKARAAEARSGVESIQNRPLELSGNMMGINLSRRDIDARDTISQQVIAGVLDGKTAVERLDNLRRAGRLTDQQFADAASSVANLAVELENIKVFDSAGKLLEGTGGRDLLKPVKTPKAKSGGKTAAESFADIVTGAQNDISKEIERARAITMTAEAAATLEQRTKLLNEANTKNITLTDGMKRKIDELAAAYGEAKVAADNAVGLRDVLKSSAARNADIQTQIDLIGKYGRELAFASAMAKLLADATAKNMTPDAIKAAMPKFTAAASGEANKSEELAHAKFIEDIIQKADMETFAFQRQRGEIGLSKEALIAYRYETDLLTAAKQKHIDLTPAEIAAIHEAGLIYAEQTESLRKLNEMMDFGRDTAKSFLSDLYGGVKEGKSIWASFADAAVNALDRIIDKLVNSAIDSLIDDLFSSSGSGGGGDLLASIVTLFSAKGNAFDGGGVKPFADGGAFTNGIFSNPTMFAFANGGALGVMGEAGPEAVMPLHRGSDGSLGVRMDGGKGSGGGGAVTVSVTNYHTLTGAISSEEVVALNKRSAEETKAELRRSIPGIVEQYQRDGSLA